MGDPHITEEKDVVIAGFHNVSSVTMCDPTLNNFFKCFEDNPSNKKSIYWVSAKHLIFVFFFSNYH